MQFIVLPKSKAKDATFDQPWAAIQIATFNKDWPKLNKVKNLGILQLYFADTDGEKRETIPWAEGEEIILFNENHAQKILDFFNIMKEKVNLFLVHCEAGRSRSPAIAAALSKIHNDNDMEFFRMFTPNMLVYRTILNLFQKQKEIE